MRLPLFLWLPLAEPPTCAGCSSSGSSEGQASGLRLPLVPSGPSGLPASSDSRRMPWLRLPVAGSPDSHRALRPQALCLSTDFRPQSSINPLILLSVSFRLSPSSGFVSSFSDSLPTYCSLISWTDITDHLPVHASANHVSCVDCGDAAFSAVRAPNPVQVYCRQRPKKYRCWIHRATVIFPELRE